MLNLFIACDHSLTPSQYTVTNQTRLILKSAPFIDREEDDIEASVVSLNSEDKRNESVIASAVLTTIAPVFIEKGIDIIGQAIIKLSGKEDETSYIEATTSNFFFRETRQNPAVSQIIFVDGSFGHSPKGAWYPKPHDEDEEENIERLHMADEPNFYMEATIFLLPNHKYLEIVPNYIYYNKHLNQKGSDNFRDLEIRFSFSDPSVKSAKNLISEGHIILKDLEVAKVYTHKELAQSRTSFMIAPSIAKDQKGYSGAFNLNVKVTETRDINKWLLALGDSIVEQKEKITTSLYQSKDTKIDATLKYEEALIDIKITEAKIEEAKAKEESKSSILALEKELLTKKAKAKKLKP